MSPFVWTCLRKKASHDEIVGEERCARLLLFVNDGRPRWDQHQRART